MTRRKSGFTLIEILIVVVILGILAAIVIPQFTNASEAAKGSNVVSQLQTIRSQIELYQVQHDGVYPDLTADWDQLIKKTDRNGDPDADAADLKYGPYLQQPPQNPLMADSTTVVGTHEADGAAAAGVGWVWEGGMLYAVAESAEQLEKAGLEGNGNFRVIAAE